MSRHGAQPPDSLRGCCSPLPDLALAAPVSAPALTPAPSGASGVSSYFPRERPHQGGLQAGLSHSDSSAMSQSQNQNQNQNQDQSQYQNSLRGFLSNTPSMPPPSLASSDSVPAHRAAPALVESLPDHPRHLGGCNYHAHQGRYLPLPAAAERGASPSQQEAPPVDAPERDSGLYSSSGAHPALQGRPPAGAHPSRHPPLGPRGAAEVGASATSRSWAPLARIRMAPTTATTAADSPSLAPPRGVASLPACGAPASGLRGASSGVSLELTLGAPADAAPAGTTSPSTASPGLACSHVAGQSHSSAPSWQEAMHQQQQQQQPHPLQQQMPQLLQRAGLQQQQQHQQQQQRAGTQLQGIWMQPQQQQREQGQQHQGQQMHALHSASTVQAQPLAPAQGLTGAILGPSSTAHSLLLAQGLMGVLPGLISTTHSLPPTQGLTGAVPGPNSTAHSVLQAHGLMGAVPGPGSSAHSLLQSLRLDLPEHRAAAAQLAGALRLHASQAGMAPPAPSPSPSPLPAPTPLPGQLQEEGDRQPWQGVQVHTQRQGQGQDRPRGIAPSPPIPSIPGLAWEAGAPAATAGAAADTACVGRAGSGGRAGHSTLPPVTHSGASCQTGGASCHLGSPSSHRSSGAPEACGRRQAGSSRSAAERRGQQDRGAQGQGLGEGEGEEGGLTRYELQKRRDWRVFGEYLAAMSPPVLQSGFCGRHVVEFLAYLDQFGKTKVHQEGCGFYGQGGGFQACECPMKQAWGSLDSLIGRLRSAYDESGGRPEVNPFAERVVRQYLKDVRDEQVRARGAEAGKKRRRRSRGGGGGGGRPRGREGGEGGEGGGGGRREGTESLQGGAPSERQSGSGSRSRSQEEGGEHSAVPSQGPMCFLSLPLGPHSRSQGEEEGELQGGGPLRRFSLGDGSRGEELDAKGLGTEGQGLRPQRQGQGLEGHMLGPEGYGTPSVPKPTGGSPTWGVPSGVLSTGVGPTRDLRRNVDGPDDLNGGQIALNQRLLRHFLEDTHHS